MGDNKITTQDRNAAYAACQNIEVDSSQKWVECMLKELNKYPTKKAKARDRKSANYFLQHATELLSQRGNQYDSPKGERSMGKTVEAFNAITSHTLSEAEGWLLLQLLKDVRQWTKKGFHFDSAVDSVTYAALKAEALDLSPKQLNE